MAIGSPLARITANRGSSGSRRVFGLARGRVLAQVRKVVAAVLLITAIVLAVWPNPTDGTTRATLVAARDLAPGTPLRASDVRVASVPGARRQADSISDPNQASGRLLAEAAHTGESITAARLLEPAGTAEDTATVPIRLADAGVAGLLQPGTRVDVVSMSDGNQHHVLASDTTVVAVTDRTKTAQKSPTSHGTGPLVLIAVPREVATRVAGFSLDHPVTVILP